jgi:hypothetical protein
MRNLTILLALIFTVTFSSPSFAKWKKVSKNTIGDTFYVDFERIRKHGGYVYYWSLTDYLKPKSYGILSGKGYRQGDCQLFRFKWLSESFHTQPMGRGTGESFNPKNPQWKYPSPDSADETVLKSVCAYAK